MSCGRSSDLVAQRRLADGLDYVGAGSSGIGMSGSFLRRKGGAGFVLFVGATARATHPEPPCPMPSGCGLLGRRPGAGKLFVVYNARQGEGPTRSCILYFASWLVAGCAKNAYNNHGRDVSWAQFQSIEPV